MLGGLLMGAGIVFLTVMPEAVPTRGGRSPCAIAKRASRNRRRLKPWRPKPRNAPSAKPSSRRRCRVSRPAARVRSAERLFGRSIGTALGADPPTFSESSPPATRTSSAETLAAAPTRPTSSTPRSPVAAGSLSLRQALDRSFPARRRTTSDCDWHNAASTRSSPPSASGRFSLESRRLSILWSHLASFFAPFTLGSIDLARRVCRLAARRDGLRLLSSRAAFGYFMRTMQTTILRWLGMGLLLAAPGCDPTFGWPNFRHPGSFAYQRWKAEVFDPYPATDVGPTPAGMRPPWYETPAPLRDARLQFARSTASALPPPKESPVMP